VSEFETKEAVNASRLSIDYKRQFERITLVLLDMKAFKSVTGYSSVQTESWNDKSSSSSMKYFQRELCDIPKPRTRSTVTIWNLPDTILVNILGGLHIKDIFSFASAHPNFREIVDNCKCVLANASFYESWPFENNLHHFKRASNNGNFEATIKLAVAYLYKEGLTAEDTPEAGKAAADYLSRAEILTPGVFPFYWIFIRPPWSPDGSCCKVMAFNHLKDKVDETGDKNLAFGIALTQKLLRLSVQGASGAPGVVANQGVAHQGVAHQGDNKHDEAKYFRIAVENDSAAAAFFSLLDSFTEEPDKAKELERIRLLRCISAQNVLEARLNLMKHYARGNYGGISCHQAQDYVRDFFKASRPSCIHLTYSQGKTTDISRYILVDWLVEVVGMKDFSAHTLYLAVSMFDRFVSQRRVQRSHVQLLGVAAMVLSSRFLGFDILTIREAAWLTDNSYSYHDVVKAMGELVAVTRGDIRVPTLQDYVKVLVSLLGEAGPTAVLVEYVAMLCLLQAEMGQYSPAELAASCMLLARLLMDHADPWPGKLQEWTGFSQDYLSLCTFHIHKKCLLEGSELDYRETKLQAVKIRYSDANRHSVSNIEVIGHNELCRRLGVSGLVTHGNSTKAIKFRNTDELIMSPRRGRGNEFSAGMSWSPQKGSIDRRQAATPPIPPINNSHVLEDGVSGYDGDLEEDFDETFSDLLESDYDRSHQDESKDWDEDDSEDSKEMNSMDGEDSSLLCDEDTSLTKSIACLSSMCHARNNVNCRASFPASPSSCVSNCSCRNTGFGATISISPRISYGAISSSHARGDSPQPSSSSTFSESSLSPIPLVPGLVQNVRQCIPSGSIRPLSKSLHRGRNSSSKAVCNISFRDTNFVFNKGERSNSMHSLAITLSSTGASQCAITGQVSQNKESYGGFDRQSSVFCNPQMVTGAVNNKSPNASSSNSVSDLTTQKFSTVSSVSKDTFLSPPCGQSRISRSGCHAVMPNNGADNFISATPETSGKTLSIAGCLNFEQFSSPSGGSKSRSLRPDNPMERALSPRRSSKRVKLDYLNSDNPVSGSPSNGPGCVDSTYCDTSPSQWKPAAKTCEREVMLSDSGILSPTRKRKCSTSNSL